MPVNRKSTVLPIGLLFFLMVGCASGPEAPGAEPGYMPSTALERRTGDVAERAAGYALQLVGRPYRYGGASPTTGFDCSGLVQYTYARAGRKLPRSTDDQRVAAQRVKLSQLQPGDLVFFDQEGKKNSHVGIYIGNGEFVHAPSSGKRVRRDRLDMPYWSRHISEARRPNG